MATGYLFLCSDATEEECMERMLFGGGEKYAKRVQGLKRGDKVFTYNFKSKKLHGLFEATTTLKKDIVPRACKGIYPMQVRVKRTADCKPLSREDIGKVLKFNGIGHPSTRLDEVTVASLERLFLRKSRVRTYNDEIAYITEDGHRVRSKPEVCIDDWLYKHRFAHAYEAPIPSGKRWDFEVPTEAGNVHIEYWGLTDAAYLKNKKEKIAIYKKHSMELLSLKPRDLKSLDVILGKRFRQ